MEMFSFVSPEVIFGSGTISQCGESAVRLGAKKIFVITDSDIVKAGWLEQILHHLKSAGLEYVVWADVLSNPQDKNLLAGVKQYKQGKCDAVLAVGGGSPIDAAKAVALLVSNGGNVSDYEHIDSVSNPLPPMLAIPTTAGSGSEVSQFAIIVNSSEKRKMTLISKSLIPNIAIYDPQFLATLDNKSMLYSGFNVLSHAIEAYVSVAANPITDTHALDAVNIVSSSLRKIQQGIRNDELHRSMAVANMKAGLAFSNAILGAVHAITHQICALYNLPAGLVDAVLLPRVMEFNLPEARYKYGLLAEALGESVEDYNSEAEKVLSAVQSLVKDTELPTSLSQIGIESTLLPTLANNVIKDICLVTNPREVVLNDVIYILRRAY
ncbi:MAG: iron-containing alcohol dehydrogenase [Firmicutes bacterium]|nr:iron-containing alcohol dehydrogenase [Bacillota bacterium]